MALLTRWTWNKSDYEIKVGFLSLHLKVINTNR